MRRWMIVIVILLIIAALALSRFRRNSSVPSTALRVDTVQLSGAPGSYSAAILLDGRRAACVEDEVVRTTQTALVPNILSPSGCGARVAVFVQDKAMYFDGAVAWTDGSDTVPVPLASMPQLPISIWAPTGGTWDANAHVLAARPIYNDMQSGIGFEQAVPIVEKQALNSMTAGCNNLAPVKAVAYSPGRLNVYYVQEITDAVDARGVHCTADDPTIILISALMGVNATLSHEVGHALTLDDSNAIDGLDDYTETTPGEFVSNLMLQAGVNQKLLSTGQCFRCNLNSASAINALGARTGPTPGCHPEYSSPECPAVSFDVVPK